ncbi:MAG: hypothetical protein KGJ60_08645 [Verrucomicrobiota bacterium]|nr:hypothetical protein [Verrucomicrobiota bacterium]
MSYAYLQGHEAQALAFFEKLLEVERNPAEREKLERVIGELRKTIAERKSDSPNLESSLQNLPANLAVC